MNNEKGLGSVYIGPLDEAKSVEAVKPYIEEAARRKGYGTGYRIGMVYGKSQVMLRTPTGFVPKVEDGKPVLAADPLKKSLVYLFDDYRVLYELLGLSATGTPEEVSEVDGEYISLESTSISYSNLLGALGLPPGTPIAIPRWVEVESEKRVAKKILVRKEPVRLGIPMNDEERQSRTLANDADRFGYEFHTKFSKRQWYDIGESMDKMKVKVKSAFTEQIYPGERFSCDVSGNEKEILQLLAGYDKGGKPSIVERTKDGGFIVSFHSANAAAIATNLKGYCINLNTIPIRSAAPRSSQGGGYGSSRPSQGGGYGSSRPSQGGGGYGSGRSSVRSDTWRK